MASHSTSVLFGSLLAWACFGCATTADPAQHQQSAAVDDKAPSAEVKQALSVTPASGPSAPAKNPFTGASFFLDQRHVNHVLSTVEHAPDKEAVLRKAASYPTGLWLDRIESIGLLDDWLKQALAQQESSNKPVVPVVVIYDLPNRDCAAKASGGELLAEQNGEARYRSEFIDPIRTLFQKYSKLSIVGIVEPDSLANMATNMDVPKCAASAELYKRSVAYSVAQLSLPNVYLYLDAAHAGWLGWDANRQAIAEIYKEVLDMAGGAERIRGFATNVSNYNALDGQWGWQLETSNPCPNEYCYVEKLAATLTEVGIADKGFIIDTSRNGVQNTRSKWGHWCNIKGAGLGERPQASPRALVDAYYWVKPPGDSDGISDSNAQRFDVACRSVDSAEHAPEAGHWFASYFLGLVENAAPPITP